VDVVKERLQVQVSASSSSAGSALESYIAAPPVYKGSLDALMQICRQEGLTGIYKGYGATLLSYGPFSALYFFLYEEVKKKHFLQQINAV
jgi:Mitochondrial carrier protein